MFSSVSKYGTFLFQKNKNLISFPRGSGIFDHYFYSIYDKAGFMEKYLAPTYFIDSDHPLITEFSLKHSSGSRTPLEMAVKLYYAVRDMIRYNPYSAGKTTESMKASFVLDQGQGYCVAKAVLLCACLRAVQIPARLGFADVKNHLNTKKLRQAMGSDIFVYHGYTDIFLENQWVKATPAFNLELCQSFNVKPLEFDGTGDSIFHPLDNAGNKHMEYLKDHGTFADLPLQDILEASVKAYPNFFKDPDRTMGDFHDEALKENQ